MPDHKKWAYFLPNVFTALNMGCGFMAIMWAFKADYYSACVILVLGALFDSVDGRIARLTGTESSFGEQFDSMSDLLSFGIAPSLLFYQRFLDQFGRPGMMLAFVFILCTAMRLARFNANIEKIPSEYFQGIPSPMAALALVGYCLLSLDISYLLVNKTISLIYIGFYALLMISTIPFPSFKNSLWMKQHKHQVLFFMILVMLSVVMYEKIMIAFFITSYVFVSLIYNIIYYEKLKNVFQSE